MMTLCVWSFGLLFIGHVWSLTVLPRVPESTRAIGENVIFTCQKETYSGDARLTWLNTNNEEITSSGRYIVQKTATSVTLYLTDIRPRDAGVYTCMDSDDEGENANIMLSLYAPIRFTRTPDRQFLVAGAGGKIFCGALGHPNPEIWWMFNDEIVQTDGHIIVEDDGLHISDVSSENQGTYTCGAQVPQEGRVKLRQIEAIVGEYEEMSFVDAPEAQTLQENMPGLVKCVVDGFPLPEVRWYFEGIYINDDDALHYIVTPQGLVVTNVQSRHGGHYQCRAEIQSMGIAETRNIEVRTIGHVWSLTVLPRGPDITRALGENVIFTCQKETDGGDARLTWLNYNNEEITSSGRYIVQKTAASVALYLTDIQPRDAGDYTCMDNDDEGENATITLSLYAPIRFTRTPDRQFLVAGAGGKIFCGALGNPNPEIWWMFNSEIVQTDEHVIVEYDGLRISDVSLGNQGTYTCGAQTAQYGRVELRQIEAIVGEYQEMSFVDAPEVQTLQENMPGLVKCVVDGFPLPEVRWYFEGMYINDDDPLHYIVTPQGLVVTNVQSRHGGHYQCRAEIQSIGLVETRNIEVRTIE